MSFFLKGILIPTIIITLCLVAIIFIFAIIPEKFREKEGKPTRHDLKPIKEPLREGMILTLTSDGTTFYSPMPPGCEIFVKITEDGCLIRQEDKKETRLIPLRNLSVIPTGVDGVPFMEEIPTSRRSIFTGKDCHIGTKYRLYVPNLAISPKDRHLIWWRMARGENSTKPLHSTKIRNPVAREVCFIVKGFNEGKVLLSLYDEDEKNILSGETFVVESERIYRMCHRGDKVFLSLGNYILHC